MCLGSSSGKGGIKKRAIPHWSGSLWSMQQADATGFSLREVACKPAPAACLGYVPSAIHSLLLPHLPPLLIYSILLFVVASFARVTQARYRRLALLGWGQPYSWS